jgi:hypothetical protein
LSGCRNKKDAAKALKIIGENPSKSKIIDRLGVDEEELDEAQASEVEYREQRIKRQRENVDSMNKKNIQKALAILGHDPSERKVCHQHSSTILINFKAHNKLGVDTSITKQHPIHVGEGFSGVAIVSVGVVVCSIGLAFIWKIASGSVL